MKTLYVLLAALALTACKEPAPVPIDRLEELARTAALEAQAATITPHEIEMIEFRGTLMGKPGLQLHVVLFGDFGQPIDYFVTDGKCTSSKKTLVRKQKQVRIDKGSYTGTTVLPSPSADGTYGSSAPYIYCFTVADVYKQWNGEYYISDRPIELTITPLVFERGTHTKAQG